MVMGSRSLRCIMAFPASSERSGEPAPRERADVPNHGDWQLGIYFRGLEGEKPSLPMSFRELERRAEATMSPEIWSYVAGGAGDENTQDEEEPVPGP